MRLVHLVTLVSVALACVGCEQKTSQNTSSAIPQKVRVGLIMKARTNPFFARMEAGAQRAADELGVDLIVWDIERETDAAKQADHIDAALSQGVHALLIAPADSEAIVAPLMRVQREGIHVINVDNRIDEAAAQRAGLHIAAFVGPDNVAGARKSTEALIKAIDGQGEVALLEGIRGAANAEARKKGFENAIEATDGKVEVVAQDTALWDREKARDKMDGFLNNHPDLDGIFCANAMMALGALSAIEAAGKAGDIVITTYDNLQETHQPIREGKIHATVDQFPDQMGALGVEHAYELVKRDVAPADQTRVIEVETKLVTAEDLESSTDQ